MLWRIPLKYYGHKVVELHKKISPDLSGRVR